MSTEASPRCRPFGGPGLRSRILYLVSAAYFLAGLQVYQIKATRAQLKAADATIEAHVNLFTTHQIGMLFMVGSALAAGIVLYEDLAPHAWLARKLREMAFGYSLMTFLLMFWTGLYGLSWIENGNWHAIYGIANYGLTVGILLLCSRIAEIPKSGIPLTMLLPLVEEQIKKDRP